MSGSQALDQDDEFRQFLRASGPSASSSRPVRQTRSPNRAIQNRIDHSEKREDTQPNERDFYDWRRPSEPPQVTQTRTPAGAPSTRRLPVLPPLGSATRAAPPVVRQSFPAGPSHRQQHQDSGWPRSRKGKERALEEPMAGARTDLLPPSQLPSPDSRRHPRSQGTILVRGFKRQAFTQPGFPKSVLDLFGTYGTILDYLFDIDGRGTGHPTIYLRYGTDVEAMNALRMHLTSALGAFKLTVAMCNLDSPFAPPPPPPPPLPPQHAAPNPERRFPSRLPSAPRSARMPAFSPNPSPEKRHDPPPQRRPVGSWSDAPSQPARLTPEPLPATAAPISGHSAVTPNAQTPPPMPSASQASQDAEEDSTSERRLELPIDCRGTSKEAGKKKQAFRIDALKRIQKEGKVVLDNSFKGDVLVIIYVDDNDDAGDEHMSDARESHEAMPPPAVPDRSSALPPIARDMAVRQRTDDVKPRVHRTPSPDPEIVLDPPVALPPAPTFPSTIKSSHLSAGLRDSCTAFVEQFFARHQQSRSALQDFYTPSAMFSCQTAPGAGQDVEQSLDPAYERIVDKIYITPTPISHALAKIPAFSCDPTTFTLDAQELDSLTVRQSSSIFLVVHGFVEEFPSHERVAFSRSFVLLRRSNSWQNAGCPVDLVIQSDQVVFRPYQSDRPLPLSDKAASASSSTTASLSRANKRSAAQDVQPARPSKRTERDAVPEAGPSSSSRTPLFFPSTATPEPVLLPNAQQDRSRSARPTERGAAPYPARRSVVAPAIRDRSRSPASESSSDEGDQTVEDDVAALSRRHERQATVAAELSGGVVSREELDAVVAETVRRELAVILAQQKAAANASSSSSSSSVGNVTAADAAPEDAPSGRRKSAAGQQRQKAAAPGPVPPPSIRPRTPPETDDEDDIDIQPVASTSSSSSTSASGSSRWPVRIGETSAVETRLSGSTNKLRYLCRRGKSGFYGVTSGGDVLDWAGETSKPVVTIHKGSSDDKVDDFFCTRDTLIVGYLGSKVAGERELAQPAAQIRLFTQQQDGKLASNALSVRPHVTGGVTSLTPIPGNRLKWVSAGQDKTLYLWTQSSSSKEVRAANIATTHTNVITSLAYLNGRGNLASGGDDKRVLLYDLSAQRPVWKGMLDTRVLHVSAVPHNENLILYRTGASARQFALYDVRRATSAGAIGTFGFALPSRSGTSATNEVSFGRYFRGDWIDSVFVHPDASTGIKMWDIRKIGTGDSGGASMPPMASLTCGRSKVLQVLYDDRKGTDGDKLVLGEQSYCTTCKLL